MMRRLPSARKSTTHFSPFRRFDRRPSRVDENNHGAVVGATTTQVWTASICSTIQRSSDKVRSSSGCLCLISQANCISSNYMATLGLWDDPHMTACPNCTRPPAKLCLERFMFHRHARCAPVWRDCQWTFAGSLFEGECCIRVAAALGVQMFET